jgi:hypothetical protein
MKKQRAIVLITIDPDEKPRASDTQNHVATNPVTGEVAALFEVNIFRNDVDGKDPEKLTTESMKTSLAHELGHVVATLANTKANADDPRSKPMGNRWTEEPGEAVVNAEREAWEIARLIAPDLDEREAARNLASYEEDPTLDGQLRIAILADMVRHHDPEKGGIN